jgi:hypothetical protein
VGGICGKPQASGGDIMGNQLAQAWLENRDLTTAKLCDAVSINIHADDLMTHIRQTRTCHEPYISGTKDTNLHNQPALKEVLRDYHTFFVIQMTRKTQPNT